jgi:Amt family ammonium transporter
MSPNEAVVIGLIAGVIIVLGVSLIDRIRLDDPVGAVTVHLICGIWGTLAVGIFGSLAGIDQFLYQLSGVAAAGAFCCLTAFIIIFALKKTVGIRVSKEEEIEGLDINEHGMDAYSDFRLNQH